MAGAFAAGGALPSSAHNRKPPARTSAPAKQARCAGPEKAAMTPVAVEAEKSILQGTNEGFDWYPELLDILSNGFVDPKINIISADSGSLASPATLDLVTGMDVIASLTANAFISADDQAMSSDSIASLITSPPLVLNGRVVDDSYIISTAGSCVLESLTVCAAPALTGAFASVPSGGCAIQQLLAADRVSIKEGTAVVVADRDMEVAVNVGSLKLAEGSVVLVSNTPSGTAIYNFHDPGKNSVLLTVSGRSVAICPGRHLHATSEKNNNFAVVNSLDRISHRSLRTSATEGGITLFSSEFSTLAALECVTPLKSVLTHKHPEARKLANQMIKTSAVLMQLGSNAEEFKYHFKPRMSAIASGADVTN